MPPSSEFLHLPTWPLLHHFLNVQTARFYDTQILHWQWLALVICMLLCLNPWIIPAGLLISIRRAIHQCGQNRVLAILVCALFPVVVRLALLPLFPLYPPSVHDEFSLLLMADTFSSGHLTMPPHPMWEHFETIHEIQQPTYSSMYPPGFGAFLAVGQAIYHPWLGVILTVALMCGTLCWMLQAWVPPAWAFGGTLIITLQIGIGSYWMNTYVGGAPVPAMAGALLLGSVPRFLKKPGWLNPMLFALATVLLVNTRPFEGPILCMLFFGLALFWYWKKRFGRPTLRWGMVFPAALVLLAGAAFTAYYSWRVTGSPLKTAYVVNRDTYGWPENLAVLPPLKLTFRHKILENMHVLEISRRDRYKTLGRMLDSWSARASILWEFYVGAGLTLALFFLPATLRNRQMRALSYIGLAVLSLNTLQLMAYPQHVSTEIGIFYLLVIGCLRQLFVVMRRVNLMPERAIAAMILTVSCAAVFTLGMDRFKLRQSSFWEWPHWSFSPARESVVSKLNQIPGKHLIIVHYADNHSAHEEWVYNSADIDHSKIVWANAMGFDSDQKLLAYFHDRQPWIIEPDRDALSFFPLTNKAYYHF